MIKEMKEPVKIYIDPTLLMKGDLDKVLMSKYDVFYRRMVEYILNILESKPESNILAILIDGDGNEYEMQLPKSGFKKSLTKANEYFLQIEEYETCTLIKDLLKIIKAK
jgi:hypothetical protein|tara:strand:- start:3726 stop:4052 length:327 start_codon:yes stop_codon:yes gene_type:complete